MHYFILNGVPFAVLGFDAVGGKVMCVDLLSLDDYEHDDLLAIVNSPEAQRTTELAPLLTERFHPFSSNELSWWDYLFPKIFWTTIDEISETIPFEQVEAFRQKRDDYNKVFRKQPENEKTEDILFGRIT